MISNINKIGLGHDPYDHPDRYIKQDCGYIPQSCLHIVNTNMLRCSALGGQATISNKQVDISIPYNNLIFKLINTGNYDLRNSESSLAFKNKVKEYATHYVNNHYLIFPGRNSYHHASTIGALRSAYIINKQFRVTSYFVHRGCVRLAINNKLTTAACLVVKRKYVELYKMYYLAGIPPFGEMFEFWIDLGLIESSVGKLSFLNQSIDEYRSSGILIRNISNIDNTLCTSFELPTFNSSEDKFNFNSKLIDAVIDETSSGAGKNFNNLKYERLFNSL